MLFDRPSIDEITKRIERGIESRLFGGTALLRFAVLRILARVFAGAIHTSYGYIIIAVRQLFVTTATNEFLTLDGRMWKVFRKAGSFASGQATFTASIGTTIPADTRIQSPEGVEYGTTVEVLTIFATEILDIQAVDSGDDGNEDGPFPISYQLVSPVSGVQTDVIVNDAITGGQDSESDEAYRKRILNRIQFPPMGGTKADFERWAVDVDGVSQSWTFPIAQGPGTVTTVITAVGSNPVPSALLLSDVQAAIEELQPITAVHTTVSIEDSLGAPGQANIEFSISLSTNTADFQSAITTNLESLFFPHTPGDNILISQVRSAISSTGVSDFLITQILVDAGSVSTTTDIVLTGFAYPKVGTILWSNL